MPRLIIFLLFLCSGFYLSAQDCTAYMPMEEGSVREMKTYDERDKLTGSTIQTVKEVKGSAEKMDIIVHFQHFDKKGEEVHQGDVEYSCEDGVFTVDIGTYMQPGTMESVEEMEVEVDATNLEIPSHLEPGMKLNDGIITIKASTGGMTLMTLQTRVFDRIVESRETITTEAGTFDCYKVTQMIEIKTLGKFVVKGIEWIAENIGTVRSESYNKKGKLSGYSVLTSLK